MPDKRCYTDDERANALAALAANGGNISRTSEQLGIPRRTLMHWRDGDTRPHVGELAQLKKLPLADKLEELAHILVDDLLTPEKRGDASFQQEAVALGIATDKMQLLRGEPTAITGTRGLTADERADAVGEMLSRVRSRRLARNEPAGAGVVPGEPPTPGGEPSRN